MTEEKNQYKSEANGFPFSEYFYLFPPFAAGIIIPEITSTLVSYSFRSTFHNNSMTANTIAKLASKTTYITSAFSALTFLIGKFLPDGLKENHVEISEVDAELVIHTYDYAAFGAGTIIGATLLYCYNRNLRASDPAIRELWDNTQARIATAAAAAASLAGETPGSSYPTSEMGSIVSV